MRKRPRSYTGNAFDTASIHPYSYGEPLVFNISFSFSFLNKVIIRLGNIRLFLRTSNVTPTDLARTILASTMDPENTLRAQAATALRLARSLPIGPERNEFRQIAICLLWLDNWHGSRGAAAVRTGFRLRSVSNDDAVGSGTPTLPDSGATDI